MIPCKTKGCCSYALNEHPESGLCDKCWWKAKAEFYRIAIERCIEWANNRETEWGDRAINAFQFLYNALDGTDGNEFQKKD